MTTVLPCAPEVGELLHALLLELRVADREHLVDQQDVGVDVDRHREAEAHVHARRVVLHRLVDELLEPGEVDDLVEPRVDLPLATAEDRAVQVDVLAAGQLGVEARPQLEQRRDLSRRSGSSRCPGRRMRAMHLSSVRLARAVLADQAEGRPCGISNDTSRSAQNSS